MWRRPCRRQEWDGGAYSIGTYNGAELKLIMGWVTSSRNKEKWRNLRIMLEEEEPE